MQIRIKLMGMMRTKSPPGNRVELPEGATVGDALRMLEISAAQIQAFSINGRLERDLGRPLAAGDELTVLPPVIGG